MSQQEFIEKYAHLAMEQQQKYGIPASVILAQAVVESANGNSELARVHNNYFGIHAVKDWINRGDPTVSYTDDGQRVPFTKHASVEESFEYHSKFLLVNPRQYGKCFGLSATDADGWAKGISDGGYASNASYYTTLMNVIKSNGLTKYDQMAMEQARSQGKTCGYMRGNYNAVQPSQSTGRSSNGLFDFPIKDGWKMILTSDFGHRNTGIAGASTEHNGIDLRADHVPLQATECGGRIKEIDAVGNNKSGKHVIVEYERGEHKYTVSYCHMDSIAPGLKEGDIVNAGDRLGISGNSSYRDFSGGKPLDPHLHLTVRRDGEYYDPKKYLGEISALGGLDCEMVRKGGSNQDLLAESRADTLARMESDPNYLASQVAGKDSGRESGDLAQQTAGQQGQEKSGLTPETFHQFCMTHDNPLEWLAFLNSGGKEEGMAGGLGLGGGGGGDLIGDLIGMVIAGIVSLCSLDMLSGDGQESQDGQAPSADIDQAAVHQAQQSGINADKAKGYSSACFESHAPVQRSTSMGVVMRT